MINRRIVGGYVTTIEQFDFIAGVLDAVKTANQLFQRIIIVTNQRGIALDVMNEDDLRRVHDFMLKKMAAEGIEIDKIYYCPDNRDVASPCRKPAPGMALKAKEDFPDIQFTKSIMVGDKISDMQFGKAVGMKTVFIQSPYEKVTASEWTFVDFTFDSLKSFIQALLKPQKGLRG